MDHSLRTISYIADIGDIVVIMARRRTMVTQSDIEMRRKRQSKILCHVFESEEVSCWLLVWINERMKINIGIKEGTELRNTQTYRTTSARGPKPDHPVKQILENVNT